MRFPKLFADTSDIKEISLLIEGNLIDGITTNPVIVANNAGREDPLKYYKKLFAEFPDKPISIQLMDDIPENMIEQGLRYSELGLNAVIKVPFIPDMNALKVAAALYKKGIMTNITALMKSDQAVLAMKALQPKGPSYVSLFFNRIRRKGDPLREVSRTRKFIDVFNLETEIICGSIHSGDDVLDAWFSGSHIVTATPKVIYSMEHDERTLEFISQSRNSWDEYIKKTKAGPTNNSVRMSR